MIIFEIPNIVISARVVRGIITRTGQYSLRSLFVSDSPTVTDKRHLGIPASAPAAVAATSMSTTSHGKLVFRMAIRGSRTSSNYLGLLRNTDRTAQLFLLLLETILYWLPIFTFIIVTYISKKFLPTSISRSKKHGMFCDNDVLFNNALIFNA